MNRNKTIISALAVLALAGASASAESISVTIENTMDSDSFFFTPVWLAAHDGSFDIYNTGTAAAGYTGLTEIAEGGNTAPISGSFAASSAGIAGGTQMTAASSAFAGDAPVYSPGESASFDFNVGDASVNRYFSYASMIIPSNDLFFANDNQHAYELFDLVGNFNGDLVINIYGRDVNDNSTEANSATGGAAFSANGGSSVAETGLIRSFFTESGDASYLDSFIGSNTANGASIGSAFGADDIIATITITQVPAPSGAFALLGGGLMMTRRRRSNATH